MMDSYNVNPEQLTYESTYPSPPVSTIESQPRKRKSSPEEAASQPGQKKKRKAWGQPVPEIKVVLPPRKRAKTAEEKEQRKNERILRNRRAADKSRQRQKAAVADLERSSAEMEKENSVLKAMLEQYRAKFGEIEGFSFPELTSTLIKSEPGLEQSAPTPMSMNTDFSQTTLSNSPAIAPNSPVLSPDNNPSLTNNLFPANSNIHDFGMDDMTMTGFESSVASGLTQYPAVILCSDLQCQPETSLTQIHSFIQFLAQLNLLWTIYGTSWSTMLMSLYQVFQILVGTLQPNSIIPVMSRILDQHFPLIVGLIFPPSTTTSPSTAKNVFRMKLLSRLLTCSPRMARLLLAATNRELRAVVEDEDFVDDAGLRGEWAKLMTLKWMIVRLEVEHGRYRRRITEVDGKTHHYGTIEGIDYVGIERSLAQWRQKHVLNNEVAGLEGLEETNNVPSSSTTTTARSELIVY